MKFNLRAIKNGVFIVFMGVLAFVLFPLFMDWIIDYRSSKYEKTAETKDEVVVETLDIDSVLCSKHSIEELWENVLLGKNPARHSAVKSIEIERLWLKNKAILFHGFITDVVRINDSAFKVEFSLAWSYRYKFRNDEFRLVCKMQSTMLDSLISKYPSLLTESIPELNQNLFIVASIDSVEKQEFLKNDGRFKNLWKGFGSVIEIELQD